MTEETRWFSEQDLDVLTALTLRTRATPEAFARGRSWLAEWFALDAVLARHEAEAKRNLDEAVKGSREAVRLERARELRGKRAIDRNDPTISELRASPFGETKYLRMVRASAGEALRPDSYERVNGHRYLPQRSMVNWLTNADPAALGAHLLDRMSRTHAEAVVLVVAFFWDRSEAPNPALPEFMQAIPWGSPEAVGGDMFAGRWLWFHPLQTETARVIRAVRGALRRLLTETGIDFSTCPSPPRAPAPAAPPLAAKGDDIETLARKPRRSRERIDDDRKGLDARAAALLQAHPEWTKRRIAQELRVVPSVLSDSRRPLRVFNAALAMREVARAERADGLSTRERRDTLRGRVEAED